MTLLFMEGFETYAGSQTPLARKYAQASNVGVTGAGRLHGTSGQFTSNSRLRTRAFGTPTSKCVIGFGYRDTSSVASDGFEVNVLSGAADQLTLVSVQVSSTTFRFDLKRGATTLASTPVYNTGNWHYFELEAVIHPSTGSYTIRHNESSVATATGVNTAASGSADWNAVDIDGSGDSSVSLLLDDLYVLDGNGSTNNALLGDSVIEGSLPSSDGATVDWTPSSGVDHYALLNDTSDATYVSSDVASDEEMLGFPDLAAITGNIHGVMVTAQMALDSLGTRTVHLQSLSGATEEEGDSQVIESTSYSSFYEIFELDPDTSVAWTVSGFNAAFFGFELVS